ncbi:MAG: hypothetical protein JXB14_01250 [Candidatus Altiarchaeota archaeon]|nr:hypothetical protein [Candidatus Altiarchaeota archaeon]
MNNLSKFIFIVPIIALVLMWSLSLFYSGYHRVTAVVPTLDEYSRHYASVGVTYLTLAFFIWVGIAIVCFGFTITHRNGRKAAFSPRTKDAFSHFLTRIKNFSGEEEEFKHIFDGIRKDVREGKDVDIKELKNAFDELWAKISVCAVISKSVKGSALERECVKEKNLK